MDITISISDAKAFKIRDAILLDVSKHPQWYSGNNEQQPGETNDNYAKRMLKRRCKEKINQMWKRMQKDSISFDEV